MPACDFICEPRHTRSAAEARRSRYIQAPERREDRKDDHTREHGDHQGQPDSSTSPACCKTPSLFPPPRSGGGGPATVRFLPGVLIRSNPVTAFGGVSLPRFPVASRGGVPSPRSFTNGPSAVMVAACIGLPVSACSSVDKSVALRTRRSGVRSSPGAPIKSVAWPIPSVINSPFRPTVRPTVRPRNPAKAPPADARRSAPKKGVERPAPDAGGTEKAL